MENKSLDEQIKLGEALKMYKELLDQGVLTEEEYNKKKEEILSSSNKQQTPYLDASKPVEVKPYYPPVNSGTNKALKVISTVIQSLGIAMNIGFLLRYIFMEVPFWKITGTTLSIVFLFFHIPFLIVTLLRINNKVGRKITLIVFTVLGSALLLSASIMFLALLIAEPYAKDMINEFKDLITLF